MQRALLFIPTCFIVFSSFVVTGSESALSQDQVSETKKIFLIGNSLTWDTVPSKLDGQVQWHVDCGKNLQYIHANPQEPCVKTSTLWPTALVETQFDIVSVQPHFGTTIDQDVEIIGKWLEMQPKAVFVIHTGWARAAELKEEFADEDPEGVLTHSNAYFDTLLSQLRELHPGREFRMTAATRLLNDIADDIEHDLAPLQNIQQLYRDKIHMTLTGGRYLMHNVMRQALGQPATQTGFEKLPKDLRTYLDGKLATLE